MTETFATRLRKVLKDFKLTQSQLASIALVSRPAVAGWLKGAVPHRKTLAQIERRLGVSGEWLLSGEGESRVADFVEAPDADVTLLEELIDDFRNLIRTNENQNSVFRERVLQLVSLYHKKSKGEDRSGQTTYSHVFVPKMKSVTVNGVLEAVAKKAARSGGQIDAASQLGVTPQQLNDWLSRRHVPGGEAILRLLVWAESNEDKKNPESARTLPGHNAQRKSSKSHEKPTPGRSKSSRKSK